MSECLNRSLESYQRVEQKQHSSGYDWLHPLHSFDGRELWKAKACVLPSPKAYLCSRITFGTQSVAHK
eukprot:scaffold651283_cov45-Prasinocladus_malaysianus.AAC.1